MNANAERLRRAIEALETATSELKGLNLISGYQSRAATQARVEIANVRQRLTVLWGIWAEKQGRAS